MASQYGPLFNHDAEAERYDLDVMNDADPIRAGYNELLEWVIKKAEIHPNSRVLELGSGTGNLSARMPSCAELVAVDLSDQMEVIALSKLRHLSNRRFVQCDILDVFDKEPGQFDRVVSTYAIHHLIEPEKHLLFEKIHRCLAKSGRAVLGDLMVKDQATLDAKIRDYSAKGDQVTVEALQEEFLWLLDSSVETLVDLGFKVEVERFSDLSYGVVASN
jgi:cyclopropane fatty-acyl-phospholipid synthase-like methyltransferase